MPQYEVEPASGERQIVRARDEADACRRAGVEEATIAPEADVQGWREVVTPAGTVARVREHSRMRFRRD